MLQLCDGATPAERQAWQLGPAKEYHYLNQSSCYQLKDVDNAAEYKVCPSILHSKISRACEVHFLRSWRLSTHLPGTLVGPDSAGSKQAEGTAITLTQGLAGPCMAVHLLVRRV